jgi:6-phosphogluconolactonase
MKRKLKRICVLLVLAGINTALQRYCRQKWLFGFTVLLLSFQLFTSCKTPDEKYLVFVGTYTGKGSEGIYSFSFDPSTGVAGSIVLAVKTDNPSFLATDKQGKFLYAVNELDKSNNQHGGALSTFSVNRKSGKLDFLGQVSSLGEWPAHLSLDKTGRFLLVANYGGGNYAVFPLDNDGKPAKHSAFVQNEGSGADPKRQEAPHAHFIQVTNDNRFVMVADLGTDKIMIHQFDETTGAFLPANPGFIQLDLGAGPRHFAFAPSGKQLYILNELSSTIMVFDYEPDAPTFTRKQTISTLPDHFTGDNTTAEILVDAKGRFLYASNRGDNSIVQYSIDSENGSLTPVAWVPSGGETPRNFEIDPTGKWLFVANQNSDNIIIFSIDQESGRLVQTAGLIKVSAPVCLRFVPLE